MSSSAPTLPATPASSPLVGNAPAFWLALVGVGVAWYLAPRGARPLFVWFVAILLVGLTLVAWPSIAGNLGAAFGMSKPSPSVVARARPVPV